MNDSILESWCLSLHNNAARTVVAYRKEAERFAWWLAEHGRPDDSPGDLLAVDRQDIEAWFTEQRQRGLTKGTIRSRWIALRSFYGWCVEEDELDVSPIAKVSADKADPGPVNVLEPDEVRRLLKVCAGRGFTDRRDAAIIATFYATGLRVAELCGLQIADVDLVQRLAVVHGKGDRDRFVRFDAETAARIDRYRRARGRHRHASHSALWLGATGPLGTRGVSSMLKRRSTAAGVEHLHPHRFRHTFADRWLASGGSEGDLQRLGGWHDSAVMHRYGAVRADARALKAYDDILGN